MSWQAVLVSLAVLVAVWFVFLVGVALARPDAASVGQTARVLPDTIRLVRRLAADPTIPRSSRLLVWLLLVYLALPIDLVPDFIPVIGYADDAILCGLVLRRLVRSAGEAKVCEQWPGTADGLAVLRRILLLEPANVSGDGPRQPS